MSKKPDNASGSKGAKADASSSGVSSTKGVGASGGKKKVDDDSGSDDSDIEPQHIESDSDDDDTSAAKKAKHAADSAEKSELAAYLATPSTYVSANPHLPLAREEIAERAEVEDLLARLKGHQKDLMDKRSTNQKDLDGMRGSIKKIRKETDELMKSQQTNLATMGRKLH